MASENSCLPTRSHSTQFLREAGSTDCEGNCTSYVVARGVPGRRSLMTVSGCTSIPSAFHESPRQSRPRASMRPSHPVFPIATDSSEANMVWRTSWWRSVRSRDCHQEERGLRLRCRACALRALFPDTAPARVPVCRLHTWWLSCICRARALSCIGLERIRKEAIGTNDQCLLGRSCSMMMGLLQLIWAAAR